jgi:hypothetical protein
MDFLSLDRELTDLSTMVKQKLLHFPRIDEAEAQVVVRVRSRVPVTIGAPNVPGFVVPAAATVHAIGTAF